LPPRPCEKGLVLVLASASITAGGEAEKVKGLPVGVGSVTLRRAMYQHLRCALWYAYAYHGREKARGRPVQAASLHAGVLRGDRLTCEDLTASWPQKEIS
jgi:hypothetical protein